MLGVIRSGQCEKYHIVRLARPSQRMGVSFLVLHTEHVAEVGGLLGGQGGGGALAGAVTKVRVIGVGGGAVDGHAVPAAGAAVEGLGVVLVGVDVSGGRHGWKTAEGGVGGDSGWFS